MKWIRDSQIVELGNQVKLLWDNASYGVYPLFSRNFFLPGEDVIQTGTALDPHDFLQVTQVQNYKAFARVLKLSKRIIRVNAVNTEFTAHNENTDFAYLAHSLGFIQERVFAMAQVVSTKQEHKLS